MHLIFIDMTSINRRIVLIFHPIAVETKKAFSMNREKALMSFIYKYHCLRRNSSGLTPFLALKNVIKYGTLSNPSSKAISFTVLKV